MEQFALVTIETQMPQKDPAVVSVALSGDYKFPPTDDDYLEAARNLLGNENLSGRLLSVRILSQEQFELIQEGYIAEAFIHNNALSIIPRNAINMTFNELTIRELRAQATAACVKVLAMLPEEQKARYDFLVVDLIEPESVEDDGWEYFSVLGHVCLNDSTRISFKARLMWVDDGCVTDSVEFLDIDVDSLIF